jgi:hypothetical protein
MEDPGRVEDEGDPDNHIGGSNNIDDRGIWRVTQ